MMRPGAAAAAESGTVIDAKEREKRFDGEGVLVALGVAAPGVCRESARGAAPEG